MTTQQDTQTIEPTSTEFGKAGFAPVSHADDADLAAIESAIAKGEDEIEGTDEAPADAAVEDQSEQTQEADPAEQPAQAAGGKPRMVPIERFNEVINERNKTREEIAELRGMVAGLAVSKGAQAKPDADPEQAPETPISRIEKLETEAASLAERYDRGELSFAEYEKTRRSIDRQIARLEYEADPPNAQDPKDDSYLREQTDRLEEEFPVLKSISADDVKAIVPLAQRQAAKDGVDFSGNTLRFRRYVAETAQRIYGNATQQNQTATADADASGGGPKPGAAAARKVEQARNAPPNLNQLSVSGRATQVGEYTPQRVAAMSDDELANLPDAVLARLAAGR